MYLDLIAKLPAVIDCWTNVVVTKMPEFLAIFPFVWANAETDNPIEAIVSKVFFILCFLKFPKYMDNF